MDYVSVIYTYAFLYTIALLQIDYGKLGAPHYTNLCWVQLPQMLGLVSSFWYHSSIYIE